MLDFEEDGPNLRAYFLVGLFLVSFNCCVYAQELDAQVQADAQDLFFPKSDSDWKRLAPTEANWDEAALKNMLRYAEEQKSSALVVLWRGQIVVEQYWDIAGSRKYQAMVYGKDDEGHALEDVASVQKSLAAVLLGIGLDKDLLKLDDPVTKYLGEGWSNAAGTSESGITLEHLVSMSSGLNNQLKFQSKPELRWKYNTNAYSRIMNVLEAASGLDRNSLTEQWLSPLQMENSTWKVRRYAKADPKTNRHGWVTSARDLARLGLLVSANGDWEGRAVIQNKKYTQAMLQSSQQLNPAYGYLWWLNGQSHIFRAGRLRKSPLNSNAPDKMVAGLGALGRKLYVVPNLQLVIVRMGDQPEAGFDTKLWGYINKVLER
ncbi:serine hydrolase [bacterium]|nr:serine hydrolase [bacterium]MDA7925703.1 serine hydrolase [Mariniblastus sp.]MDB4385838.1 serine hydrolase [bacterium]